MQKLNRDTVPTGQIKMSTILQGLAANQKQKSYGRTSQNHDQSKQKYNRKKYEQTIVTSRQVRARSKTNGQ